MKKISLLLGLLLSLNACAVPLVGSVIGNGGTILATGKFEQALVKQGLDLALHSETGKTTSGHIFKMLAPGEKGLAVAPTYDPVKEKGRHAVFLQGAKIYFE